MEVRLGIHTGNENVSWNTGLEVLFRVLPRLISDFAVGIFGSIVTWQYESGELAHGHPLSPLASSTLLYEQAVHPDKNHIVIHT